jgi:hypothetical protein
VSSNEPNIIIQFARKCCVSETLVRQSLADMELTKLKADQRKQNKTDKKRKEKDMTFNDID